MSISCAAQDFSFSFFIENNEGNKTNYSYEIWAEGEKKQSGEVILENSQRKQIDASISFSQSSSDKQKVLVKVFKQNSLEPYTLWFWVNVS